MFEQGRSLDDLPLAAFSTGSIEDEPDSGADPATAQPSQEPQPGSADTLAQPPVAPPRHAAATAPASPRTETVIVPVAGRDIPAWEASLRTAIRDPRALAGGAVVLGIVVIAVALGGGGPPGAPAPSGSPTPAPIATTQVAGAVTLTLSGGLTGTYNLAGATGLGRPAGDRLDASWTDASGNSLSLTGIATSGVRPTGADLVLTWTVVVNGKPVTFTSNHGECILGMALKPKTISGSITCTKLRSDDRKVVVGIAGDYRT